MGHCWSERGGEIDTSGCHNGYSEDGQREGTGGAKSEGRLSETNGRLGIYQDGTGGGSFRNARDQRRQG